MGTFGGRDRAFGGRDRAFGVRDRTFGVRDKAFAVRDKAFRILHGCGILAFLSFRIPWDTAFFHFMRPAHAEKNVREDRQNHRAHPSLLMPAPVAGFLASRRGDAGERSWHMPFPLLFLFPIAFGGVGVGVVVKGSLDMKEAEERARRARERFERARSRLKKKLDALNAELAGYARWRQDVYDAFFPQLLEYLAQLKIEGRLQGIGELPGLRASEPELRAFCLELDRALLSAAGSGVAGYLAGKTAAASLLAYVAATGTASTGTAIATLSGAAAAKASLAVLGGGTLAAGGAGVAGGMMVLGGVVAAPAILFAGLSVLKKGEEALTRAAEIEAEADAAIARMKNQEAVYGGTSKYMEELRASIHTLHLQAGQQLFLLQHDHFAAGQKNSEIKKLLNLAHGLVELLRRDPTAGEEPSARARA